MKRVGLFTAIIFSLFLKGQEDSLQGMRLIYEVDYQYAPMDSMELEAMKMLEQRSDTIWVLGTQVYQKYLMENGGVQHRLFDLDQEEMDLFIDHSVMRVNIYYRGLDFRSHIQRKDPIHRVTALDTVGKFKGYQVLAASYVYEGDSNEFQLYYLENTPENLFPEYLGIPGVLFAFQVPYMGALKSYTLKEMEAIELEMPEFYGYDKMTEEEFLMGLKGQ